ncbi:hypothetical protein [Pseudochrobactrum asaccharolyticum]|uniref:Uncharacterized protein n=1 Tax=Pseudochrobactrum asaccharolyticum TaxID=354351 RepID=A0A366E5R5_9HYPH|nr:hypothetical protein [Pseudochrobactrum asaccharolyticum]RBO97642.1 hypothetical protein DFR47_102429 [Pseudochrobactrum asaccharolyticum]
MDKSLQLIGRFTVIVFGYGCAVLAAGFLLNVLLLATIGFLPDIINDGFEYGFGARLFVATPFMAIIVGYLAFWPALLLIASGEYFNKRDSLFYSLGGMISGIVLFIAGFEPDVKNADEAVMLMSIAAAGITGGFVYWLVSGRWTNVVSGKKAPETK